MFDLVRAALPREVFLGAKGRDGSRRALVPAPSVGQALAVYATAPGVLARDEADERALWDALRAWLPAEVYADVENLDARAALAWASGLADEGTFVGAKQLAEGEAGEPSEVIARMGRMRWELLLAGYAAEFGGGLWETYERTPWAVFLLGLARLEQARAMRTLRDADAILLPATGKEMSKAIGRIQRKAGKIEAGRKTAKAAKAEDEAYRRNIEELRGLFGAANDGALRKAAADQTAEGAAGDPEAEPDGAAGAP